ncbi:MAG: hypothetical protein GX295_01545 [Syntrophomonadaceae bacterium]|nr:hypothetical protein [Syntrophomonadaceae bacterium]
MDSHADDIIQIVREEFGEGNAFCPPLVFLIGNRVHTGRMDDAVGMTVARTIIILLL